MEFKRKKQEFAGRQREVVECIDSEYNIPTSLFISVNIPSMSHLDVNWGPTRLKVKQLEELLRNEGFEKISYLPSSNGYEPCIQSESQRECMEGSYNFKLYADIERKVIDKNFLPFSFNFKRYQNRKPASISPVIPSIEKVVKFVEDIKNYRISNINLDI